ncbi:MULTISPECIES: ImmA/IrrE family metallo-endopeptidase [unclassified Enterococcus]|uniref:ImmA/IrrE family metallo-endopeptidase n=1 Tax=unclassified Enterococcus TaxID=2608891 RepID=UPI001555B385|nr:MULTISPECIES: ImmA/IrrE family metallo-endopeptidase [unclassified Enterococcus]MBS7576013.1 ImmA/IrrE family metallo-endopeptidase [Enterococcus sp. MMGLQ5-2]MBS7583246.1 ImmA/IrrE family metallo-endopeptidase [Enterococcus sp. MMGLQ5-1]NPD11106.1 ImmA/IrrE family metallo-endopeptidase [Enterococcus sp. MMGLQ5-1]NPD35849.1 ImmA/IrrE family metallo-endopeptidase [Enterococcus sp. MMGLQ5-2]
MRDWLYKKAKTCGLKIIELSEKEMEDLPAIYNPELKVIIINIDYIDTFILAHEIAHHVLGHNIDRDDHLHSSRSREEAEADELAIKWIVENELDPDNQCNFANFMAYYNIPERRECFVKEELSEYYLC